MDFHQSWLVFITGFLRYFAVSTVANILLPAYPSMVSNSLRLMGYRRIASDCANKSSLLCSAAWQSGCSCLSWVTDVGCQLGWLIFTRFILPEFVRVCGHCFDAVFSLMCCACSEHAAKLLSLIFNDKYPKNFSSTFLTISHLTCST